MNNFFKFNIKKNNNLSYVFFSNKHIFFIFLFFILLLVFLFSFTGSSFAALFDNNSSLIDKLQSAFETIEKWLLTLATPAAAVSVGVGVFMKKFSFGDEERIRVAKKLIRGSLFSYAFILAIDLILSTIHSLVS